MAVELAFSKCPNCGRQAPVSLFVGKYRVSCSCGCMDSVRDSSISWIPEKRAKTFKGLVHIEYAARRDVSDTSRDDFMRELALDDGVN